MEINRTHPGLQHFQEFFVFQKKKKSSRRSTQREMSSYSGSKFDVHDPEKLFQYVGIGFDSSIFVQLVLDINSF